MMLPSIRAIEAEPGKLGCFYFVCKVIKGFRYRYLLVWNEKMVVDPAASHSKNTKQRETNFIEVLDSQNSLADYLSEHNPDLTLEEAEAARNETFDLHFN